jgi:hypothetical protein
MAEKLTRREILTAAASTAAAVALPTLPWPVMVTGGTRLPVNIDDLMPQLGGQIAIDLARRVAARKR